MQLLANYRLRLSLMLILIFAIMVIAIMIQSHALLNWDVSFLMDAAARVLQGGSYTQNFFETNPPMIFYLYIPSFFIMKYTGFSKATALILYVTGLFLIVIYFCHHLLQKIFYHDPIFIFITICTLSVIFLLLPTYEFGQREHLLFLLSTPYLLLMTARLKNIEIHTLEKIGVGILGGLGFAIKPFFPLIFIIIELFYAYKKRNILACLRVESFIITLILIGYLISIMIFFNDYIKVIIPLLLKLYYPGFGLPLLQLALTEQAFFSLTICIAFILWRSHTQNSLFYDVLGLALISYLLIFFLEKTAWYYHVLPAFSTALLLSTLLLYEIIKKNFLPLSIRYPLFLSIFICFIGYGINFTYHNSQALIIEAAHGERAHIINFLKTYPPHTTWALISTNATIYPAFDYANMISTSRFANYWWLPGMISLKKKASSKANQQFNEYLNYFTNMVIEDISQKKPKLIFVDSTPYNVQLRSANIDYLKFLSQNKNFHKIWQQYQRIAVFKDFDVYEYQS